MSALRRSLALAMSAKLALAQISSILIVGAGVLATSPARATCTPSFLSTTIGADAECIFRDYETDGIPASGPHNPKKSEIREWGDVIGALGAPGAAARNMLFLDPRDPAFGAKCDGSTDDYTALQNWASSAAANVVLVLPPGKCMTSLAPIVFPVSSHYSVIGAGPTTSSIVYTGAATNVDILQFGLSGGSAFFGVTLRGFNIHSNTTMTGGYALHALGMSSGVVQDVFADSWNTGDNNGKLCGGYWFDGVFAVDMINPNTSSAQACGDGLKVNDASGFSPGAAEVRVFGGNIGGNPGGFIAGLHMAGGFGGLRCDGTNIAANRYGMLIDNAAISEANREFVQGSTCVFDNNVLAGVKINDAIANGGSGGAGGTLDFAGWIASTRTGHGVEVDAWANSDIEIRGNKLYNNCGSGLYVADATTFVKVSDGVSINNNGNPAVNASCPAWQASNPGHGYGIEATSSTSRIFSFASMWSNTAGNTNVNSHAYDWTQQGAGLLALAGNGEVYFGLNAIQSSHAAAMYFLTGGAQKWQIGKDTDDTFGLWDSSNSATKWLRVASGGNSTIGESSTNVHTFQGLVKAQTFTVAGLPTCNAGATGEVAYVSDASAPTFNATLAGGGAVKVLAFCNGSNWTAH